MQVSLKLWSIKAMIVVSITIMLAFAANTEVQAGKVAQIKTAIARSPLGTKALSKAATWSAIVLFSTTAITGKALAQDRDVPSPTQQTIQTQLSEDQNSIPLYEVVRELDQGYFYYNEIKKFLKTGEVDVNARDEEGNTGLHVMVQNGYVDVMLLELLLDHGVDATIVNNAGETAQAYVSDMIVDRLDEDPEAHTDLALWTKLTYGINGKDKEGKTALDYALDFANYTGDIRLVRLLLKEGARISSTSFLKKTTHKHLSMRRGEYLLEIAVKNRNVEVAEFLLNHGVIPNSYGDLRPHLFFTTRMGGKKAFTMVSILLARGADGNYRDNDRDTPYDYFIRNTKRSRINAATRALLLLAKVGAEGKDAKGRTPMHWAELSGSETLQKIITSELGITKLFNREMRQQIIGEVKRAKRNSKRR